ncbi:MAG TPA: ATPase, T2SS/T4P/T4SS family [Candidatus Saccharimonadales bacterium]
MGVKDSFIGKLLGSADKFSDEQVTQTVNLLVSNGVKHHASDIHIEPHERHVLVRYRIDGTLRGMHKLPLAALQAVTDQIKTLAHLHAGEEFVPQEGQYATLVGEEQFEVQVNTLPVLGGEKVVMHLSRRLTEPPSLEELGYWGDSLRILHETLTHNHGILLVATPRRGGKTTAIHSMLQTLNIPSSSIATVERSIEYRLPGVSQTQIRPQHGITFYDGLQAALNQDPNVVMISSLPDGKTADLAIQAAVGGHFVIVGLHASNAALALSHVRTMSSEPFLMGTSARTVVSQRLVRKLCGHCRERYIPGQEQVTGIEQVFGVSSPASRRKVHELEQQAANNGVGTNHHANTTPSHITSLWRASDDGCEACNHTGYQGAIAIVEVLQITEQIQQAVIDGEPANKLRSLALKNGFIPMELDGLVKALRGQTTISEILRTAA